MSSKFKKQSRGGMQFNQNVIEELNYYVYCIINPRDNKIFYVGKGKGERVLNHVQCALTDSSDNPKSDIIREIEKIGR